jgi:methionyl aminopeptidase
MILKKPEEIQIMHEGGKILAKIRKELKEAIKPGITTDDLESLAKRLVSSYGAKPAFLHYRGFPAILCTSINEEVVHCPPSGRELKEGDILSIDLGIVYKGWNSDTATTVPVGKISGNARRLIEVTKKSLDLGIKELHIGKTLGDVGYAIQKFAESQGFGVVRDLTGHGIGKALHEEPTVLNYGKRGDGPVIKEGLVVAIEPMLTEGDWKVVESKEDGLTYKTVDGKLAAHFEHTIAVTKNGPIVLTK